VLLALGIYLVISGRNGGILVTVLGGGFTLFGLFMIPLARRRGKI
jgi:hypothetical protein